MNDPLIETNLFKLFIRKIRDAIRFSFYRLINKLGVPNIIQNWEYEDKLTGQKIKIKTSFLFTILTIDRRDYYFYRLSGGFDGTSMSFPTAEEIKHYEDGND